MRASLWKLAHSARYRRPTPRLPRTERARGRSSHVLLGALAADRERSCLCPVATGARSCALIKPFRKAPLSRTSEGSEDGAEWSENDDYSGAFVGLGSQRRALPLQLASGEGFCLGKARSGEQKPCFTNTPAPLHPGLALRAAPGKLLGSPTRLPGGLLTSPGYPSSWHFAFPVLGLWSCMSPWAPAAWLVGYELPWLLSPCEGWPATRSLPRAPHAHACVSGCVTRSPWGSPEGNFLKIPVLGKIHISDSSFMFGMHKKWGCEIFLKMVILIHA